MKRSDVEAQTNYFIPRVVTTFEKAYPTVESIRVEIRPSGEGFEPFRGQTEHLDVYTEKSIPAIIDCRNPRCYGGGLNLDYLIRCVVVEAQRTEYETTEYCRGYEGSPKGRRKYGDCDTIFRLRVNVTYKKPESGP